MALANTAGGALCTLILQCFPQHVHTHKHALPPSQPLTIISHVDCPRQPAPHHLQVAVRVRPRNQKETDAKSPNIVDSSSSKKTIALQVKEAGKIKGRSYAFDDVFNHTTEQIEV